MSISAGCKAEGSQASGGLTEPDELESVTKRLTESMQLVRSSVCVRPVLRGTPKPGSGTAALAAAVDDSACERVMGTLDKREDLSRLMRELRFPHGPASSKPWSRRSGPELRFTTASLPNDYAPCEGVIRAVREAIEHEAVCGPNPDVTSDEKFAAAKVHLTTKMLTARAVASWRSGDTDEALTLVLDALAIQRDIIRANDARIPVKFDLPSDALESILNDSTHVLSGARLERVGNELKALMEGAPDWRDNLRVTAANTARYLAKAPDNAFKPAFKGLTARERRTLEITGVEVATRLALEACPEPSAYASCADALSLMRRQMRQRRDAAEEKIRLGQATRELYVDAVVGGWLIASTVRAHGTQQFRLAALRVHVQVRQLAEKGQCPTPGPSAQDPATGKPMFVREVKPLHWELAPHPGSQMEGVHRVRCNPRETAAPR